jgi:DNA-binding transcriptional ArsR family regulator
MPILVVAKAVANDRRLLILHWLKNPRAHFRRQVDGDLDRDGVCGLLIAHKLGVSQPTASEHLKALTPPARCAPGGSGSGRSIAATRSGSPTS